MIAHPMQSKNMQGNKQASNSLADLESALDNKQHTPAPAPQSAPRADNRPNRPLNYSKPPLKVAVQHFNRPPARTQTSRPGPAYNRQPVTPPRPPSLKVLVGVVVAKKRSNDFFLTKKDELLFCPDIPTGAYADDDEGLARSFVGLETHNRTTIAQVREIPYMTTEAFEGRIKEYLLKTMPDMAVNYGKLARKLSDRTLAVAKKYSVNSLVEYRDGRDNKI